MRGVRLGLSLGLCIADPDCFLTDREILAHANLAKQAAKAAGKGGIGVSAAPDFDAVRIARKA